MCVVRDRIAESADDVGIVVGSKEDPACFGKLLVPLILAVRQEKEVVLPAVAFVAASVVFAVAVVAVFVRKY